MNCRDGARFQDVFVSFTIGYAVGYTVGYYFPITTQTPLMDAILTGAARGAITNGLTQSYNIILGQKTHQDKFSVTSFTLSIATGAASGALDSWGGLIHFGPFDWLIEVGGGLHVEDVKILALAVIGMEELIYWTQRQNN